jgi:hypothetical protein
VLQIGDMPESLEKQDAKTRRAKRGIVQAIDFH